MFGVRSFTALQIYKSVARSSPRSRSLGLMRFNSTASNPLTSTKPAPNFFRLSYLWYGLVLATGASAGFALRNFAAPPALPTPGSKEDTIALSALSKDIDKLDIVTFMRSLCAPLPSTTPSDTPSDAPEGEKKDWVELHFKRNITESPDDEDKMTRIVTQQTMAGSQGLGIQRAFWNTVTRELIAVVWIGGALAGWPTVAHGGAIATIFEDAMSRMVAGPSVSLDSMPSPSSLSITYAQPTNVLNFYILRANYQKPRIPVPVPEPAPAKSWLSFWKDDTKKEPQMEAPSAVEIVATLESIEGKYCVRAKGTFPASAT